MLLKMAYLNVFRNKKRSILSMLTIIVGVMGMIMAYGLARGVEDTMIRVDMDTDFGHLRVTHKKYIKEESNMPLDLLVQQPKAIIKRIKQKWPSAIAFERLVFAVDISDGTNAVRCRGVALPPEAAHQAYNFTKQTLRKTRLKPGENALYIGADLAKLFEKKVGDSLTLLVRTKSKSLNAIDFTIKDILKTGNMMIDGNSIYVSLQTGRKLLQMPTAAVDVIVRLPDKSQSIAAAALLKDIGSTNFPRTWQHKMQDIIELQKLDRQFYNLLIAIIMFVAGIGIANTMLMSGYERHGEIGMMMAQGMRNVDILKMFSAEAGFLGLFGSLIGAVIGGSVAYYFQAYGLAIPGGEELGETVTMSVSTTIHFSVNAQLILLSISVGIIIAILGSLWPAWRFTRQKPLDVLTGGVES
jgi:putative ABC transport system permease protein